MGIEVAALEYKLRLELFNKLDRKGRFVVHDLRVDEDTPLQRIKRWLARVR